MKFFVSNAVPFPGAIGFKGLDPRLGGPAVKVVPTILTGAPTCLKSEFPMCAILYPLPLTNFVMAVGTGSPGM